MTNYSSRFTLAGQPLGRDARPAVAMNATKTSGGHASRAAVCRGCGTRPFRPGAIVTTTACSTCWPCSIAAGIPNLVAQITRHETEFKVPLIAAKSSGFCSPPSQGDGCSRVRHQRVGALVLITAPGSSEDDGLAGHQDHPTRTATAAIPIPNAANYDESKPIHFERPTRSR